MRRERPRLELGMKLHTDEPGMILILNHLGQESVGRHAGKAHAVLLEPVLVPGIDFIAVAVALGNLDGALYFAHPAAALEHGGIGTEPHRAAKIVVDAPDLELVSLHPFRHQAHHRMGGAAEFSRVGVLDAAEIEGGFNDGHLHSEANPEIRHLTLARELCGSDFSFAAALAEPSRNQNAVHMLEERGRVFALEYL